MVVLLLATKTVLALMAVVVIFLSFFRDPALRTRKPRP